MLVIGLWGRSLALGLYAGQAPAHMGAHPPKVSGVVAHSWFQVWVSRPLIEVRTHPGALGLCAQAARPLIRLLAHPGFHVWAPRPLICVHAKLGFQAWGPSLLIWVSTNWASGESWGFFSRIHNSGVEGGVAPEARAAAESSLTSH